VHTAGAELRGQRAGEPAQRVSLWAQQLKTPYPISFKPLEKCCSEGLKQSRREGVERTPSPS
jgi:hypothetical protein